MSATARSVPIRRAAPPADAALARARARAHAGRGDAGCWGPGVHPGREDPPPPRAAPGPPPPPTAPPGGARDLRSEPAVAHDACLHAIRSSLEMSSPWSRSVRARMMLSNSASFTARSSMFSGCTYTTIAGFIGWALIAIIGERPYLTPVKKRALSLVDP